VTATSRRRPYAHTDSRGRAKVAFTTLDRAVAVARRQAREHGWPQDVYVCRRCSSWHHGTGSTSAIQAPRVIRVWPDGEVVVAG